MKTIKQNLKWAAKILSFLILLQSCTVYHKTTSSVDEAIASKNVVKINVPNNDAYKFKNLNVFENEYYGLAKIKSDTYKRLTDRKKIDLDDRFRYVQLNEEELRNIHLKNEGASIAITFAIPVAFLGIALGIFALTY